MKKIVMQNNKVKFEWNGNNCICKYTEFIEQYHYDSEDEKMQHKERMEADGWHDSGQIREVVSDSLMPGTKPVYVWFGSYYKAIRE